VSEYVPRKGRGKKCAFSLRINLWAIIFAAKVFHKNITFQNTAKFFKKVSN